MKIWTYTEMKTELEDQLDLRDETFISPSEMIGYFNEALTESASEIYELNQDYFLTQYFVPLVQGAAQYNLPFNIFANRIRGVVYANGSIIYEVARIRRFQKFVAMALISNYGQSDDYSYNLVNNSPGQAQLILYPVSRDTAILSPVANQFVPMSIWYLRDVAQVPLPLEFCNPELVALTQVDIGADTIQTYSGTATTGLPSQGLPGSYPGSIAYVTGDAIKFTAGPNGSVPSPLVDGTTYYVIALGSGLIKVASSLQNALAGTAINLTTTGTVYFVITVSATDDIIDATLIDIPEFSTFIKQWVRCRCMQKDGDPRIDGEVATLGQQRAQLNNTLQAGVDDDNTQIQMDKSSYHEMS